VLVLAEQELKAWELKPHILWKLKYGKLFPKLEEPSIIVAVMSTQSADV
jgi:hypothetical protein